jgi:thiol-disulfide isomerase/thioredoxin
MAQSRSVACPACGASLKIIKDSLIGKRVPCPSCKAPFKIELPKADKREAPKDDYVPLADDGPLTSAPSASRSVTVKPPAPDSDDIPLLTTESSASRRDSRQRDPAAKSASKKSTSNADIAGTDRKKKSSSDEVRSQSGSKSDHFASRAESAEFDAMLADSSGTNLFDDDEPKPVARKRSGKQSGDTVADAETSEFDSMLADTDEQEEQSTQSLPPLRRKKPPSVTRTNLGTDEGDALPTVEMDIDEQDGLPLPPARAMRAPGGWRPAQQGPIVIWTCVGAGVCLLLLVYVMFSTSSSSAPPVAPTTSAPPVVEKPDAKPEVADSEPNAATKAEAADKVPASGKASLLRNPDKGSDKPSHPSLKKTGATPRAPGSSEEEAAQPNSASLRQTLPLQGRAATGADAGMIGVAVRPPQSGAGTPFDARPALAASAAGGNGDHGGSPSGVGTGSLGRSIAPFSASAVDNTTYHSADHKEQVLVVAFLGVECPLANLYAPSLAALAKKYRGKSVDFLAVNSNAQDSLDAARVQARANGITFPVVKDAAGAVADLFGAQRTPEVFVLDAQRTVRYRGMLDDQYGYRERRSKPTKAYVADAVNSLLQSENVAVAETEVQGCHIGRVTRPSETAKSSYYRDVLPILQNRCQQCHRKGEIGPFALSDYEVVRDWAPSIREAVVQRRMPPWPADPKIGKFTNDISLSDREVAAITQWVDDGCPQGDAAEKPPEKQFIDGWNIGHPDRVYTMAVPYHVPATGVVEYKHFDVSPVFTKDTWVNGVECRFGNRSVVHHMLVLLDFPKDKSKSQDGLVRGFFAAGAPGASYYLFPEGYAKKIPKGARLRFQMHYTPNGTAANDQSKFGILLAKGNSFQEVQTYALGKPDILIHAGDPNHVESASLTVPADVTLTTLMPHLHVRGKSFEFFIERPGGTKEPLLFVPKWDFNWQYQYELEKPLVVAKGSKLVVEAHWDNSIDNPNNFLPLVDVRFGEQTFDEMFIGYINAIPSKAAADAGRSTHPRRPGKRG